MGKMTFKNTSQVFVFSSSLQRSLRKTNLSVLSLNLGEKKLVLFRCQRRVIQRKSTKWPITLQKSINSRKPVFCTKTTSLAHGPASMKW